MRIKPDFFSTSVEGTQPARFSLIKNATLGSTTFTDISTNTSVVGYNTASYTSGTGQALITFQCGKTESLQFLLDSLNIYLAPGDTLTITAYSGGNTIASASLSWVELF